MLKSRVVHARRAVLGAAVGITGASLTWSAAPAEADPSPVVVIVMENESYDKIVGNPQAPFINSMMESGDLKTHYTAVHKGSGQNYLAMTSGLTVAKTAKTAPNLFGDLGKNISWRSFQESMPSTCFTGSNSNELVSGSHDALYTKVHNPAMRYNNVAHTSLCNNSVPMDPQHFDPENLPAFSFIAPNECNDMHTMPSDSDCPMWDGTTNTSSSQIGMGDNWLAQVVPLIAPHATIVLTFDEGCCKTEHVVTVIYGAGIGPDTDDTNYDHFSLEAGLYAHYGLGKAPGQGGSATPMVIP